jgi:LuxR family maltose regulon positive regulatory protein
MLAPFLGAGTARLHGLLQRLVVLRPAQSDFPQSVLQILGQARSAPASGPPVEQVSDREKTVLRYLATMLSNAEIAEQMFLSPNTIKVHLRHVYRKLDVTSRRAAVRRARELHLLDDEDA